MSANAVTLSRIPLLLVILVLLYQPTAGGQLAAAILIMVSIALNSVDGAVARARGEVSLMGSMLDIAVDRVVEYVLWVVFADLRLIPVGIPLIVIIRGSFVDMVRSVAPAQGKAPFDLMRTSWGRFLVKSPWMRSGYGIAKASAFVLLALAFSLQTGGNPVGGTVLSVAQVLSWIAVAFCVVRGLPVLLEAPTVLRGA
jgi:CDP-diacylglycerol--glycerol-3-phosphate 3-phosphatidyltransferase